MELTSSQANDLKKSVWLHEVGHSLGLDETDNTKVMRLVSSTRVNASIRTGGLSDSYVINIFPLFDDEAPKIILTKANTSRPREPAVYSPFKN